MSALAVKDVQIVSNSGIVVRGISFAIERGTNLTILGETGSGKSLVAHAIMGTLARELKASGEVVLEGHATRAEDVSARRRLWGRNLAMLPQEPWLALDPTMRVIDQVAEGFLNEVSASAHVRARAALRGLGLEAAANSYPFELSGGMAQRVALAATGTGGASLLLVDEPTKGLDADLRDDAVALLKAGLAGGRTLLTITHDVQVARALGGEVIIMLEGEVVEQGPASSILAQPSHSYTQRLLVAEPRAWPARAAAHCGETILAATNISKCYGSKRLFDKLDITVRAGARLAVTGPSGAGKTTIGNILLGLVRPDSGRVERAPTLPGLGLQKLYQDPVAAFAPRVSLKQSFDDLIARHKLDASEVPRLMLALRLHEGLLQRLPGQVSGGELQRLALVRLLLLNPCLIFADEPTSRLDLITQQETMNLLVEHASARNCALLLVTHDADIAANVAGTAMIPIVPARPAGDARLPP